jgi:hypothetical protein
MKPACTHTMHAGNWCPETDLNCRHLHFQCSALPTELSGQAPPSLHWRKLGVKGLDLCLSRVQHVVYRIQPRLAGDGHLVQAHGVVCNVALHVLPGRDVRNGRTRAQLLWNVWHIGDADFTNLRGSARRQ